MTALDVLRAGAVFDLSGRAKFRLTGADRLRFLNGQVTNDVRRVSPQCAIPACVLSAKGKIDAHIFISAEADALIIDSDEEVREMLPARLDRYIIADDAAIEDTSGAFSLFHVIGAAELEGSPVSRSVAAERFPIAGRDLWVERSRGDELAQRLRDQLPLYDSERVELLRIELGLPRWGRELTPDVLPPEANLESSCIDYNKGCYIGQEVISRMKMSGQVSKRLRGLVSAGPALHAGMKLVSSDAARPIGSVTSATFAESMGRHVALGYLKRGFDLPGTVVRVTDESGRDVGEAEAQALPFSFGAEK